MAQVMTKDYSCDSTLPIEGPGPTVGTQDYVAGIVSCLYAVANTLSSYTTNLQIRKRICKFENELAFFFAWPIVIRLVPPRGDARDERCGHINL
jgi:hypothetical protein